MTSVFLKLLIVMKPGVEKFSIHVHYKDSEQQVVVVVFAFCFLMHCNAPLVSSVVYYCR